MKIYKKIIIGFLGLLVIPFTSYAITTTWQATSATSTTLFPTAINGVSPVTTSASLASSSLTNGYVLQTNGQINTWVATSSLGITSGLSSTTITGLVTANNGTLGSLSTSSIPINVKDYGAKGDGVTNDTAAVQAAMNAGSSIYFPTGKYVVGNLLPNKYNHLYGDGVSSVLSFLPSATGYMLNGSTSTPWSIENMDIDGGSSTVSFGGFTTPPGNRSGLHFWVVPISDPNASTTGTYANNVTVTGFNNLAVGINGDVGDPYHNSSWFISNSHLYNNWTSIDTGPGGSNNDVVLGGANGGEYGKITNNSIGTSYYDTVVDSGNMIVSNNDMEDSTYGIYINGNVNNPGHFTATSNTLNHSGNPFYVVNDTIGGTFVGNQVFFGNISITGGTTALTIADNTLNVQTLNLSSTGYVQFKNNVFIIPPLITDTSTNTQWFGNYNTTALNIQDNLATGTTQLAQNIKTITPYSTSTSPNAVTNGTFTSGTGWIFGADWSLTGGFATHTHSGTDSSLVQNLTDTTLAPKFAITFTVSNYSGTSSDIAIILYGSDGGYSVINRVSANGTYTLYAQTDNDILNGGQINFIPENSSFKLSNVSIYGVLPTTSRLLVNTNNDSGNGDVLQVNGNSTLTGNLTVTGSCTGCGSGGSSSSSTSVGSAGTIQFASSTAGAFNGSSTALVWNNTTGRLSIGTSTATNALTINGSLDFTTSQTESITAGGFFNSIIFSNNLNGGSNFQYTQYSLIGTNDNLFESVNNSTSAYTILNSYNGAGIILNNDNTAGPIWFDNLRTTIGGFDSSGKFVLGNNSASALLTINQQTAASTTNFVNIVSSIGSSIFKILANGSVGIGTTSPSGTLGVQNSVSGNVAQFSSIQSGTIGGYSSVSVDGSGRTTFMAYGGLGGSSNGGAYFTADGLEETYFNLITRGNTAGQTYMRFGNASGNNFVIQRLNDAGSSITSTPFTLSNAAPTNSIYVNSSGDVGINTASPSNLLDVRGGSTSGAGFSDVANSNATNYLVAYSGDSSNPTEALFWTTGTPLLFATANMDGTGFTELARFTSAGSLGIGTTTPSAFLSLKVATGTMPFLVASSSGATLLDVLSNGNVGIGTGVPSSTLSVAGTVSIASSTAPSTNYSGDVICYVNVGTAINVLGHMTQTALLSGAGSASCIPN